VFLHDLPEDLACLNIFQPDIGIDRGLHVAMAETEPHQFIITHAYLLGALLLCAAEVFTTEGRLSTRYLIGLGSRYGAAVVLAWLMAFALWPWLQIDNPFAHFKIALVHFSTIPMSGSVSTIHGRRSSG
jgi:hypothetical protein